MSDPRPLSPAAQRVQEELRERGFRHRVVEREASTRSAAEAAAAVGCTVAQIAKSILFRAAASGEPVMVIASGANRIDEAKIAALLGEALGKADATFVRDATGFAIGGVPPLGHARPVRVFIDEDLMGHATIWAAAGTPNAVFPLAPADLVAMTGGTVAAVKA